MHREDHHGPLGQRQRRAIRWPELEDEEVEPVLLPRVDVVGVSHSRADRAVFRRALQRDEELGVGARQVLTRVVVLLKLLVYLGRTGRSWISSTAPRRDRYGRLLDRNHQTLS